MQRQSNTISLIARIAKIVARIHRRRITLKLRMYLETCLDLEEEKEVGMQLGC
jgi:hypothetical protein